MGTIGNVTLHQTTTPRREIRVPGWDFRKTHEVAGGDTIVGTPTIDVRVDPSATAGSASDLTVSAIVVDSAKQQVQCTITDASVVPGVLYLLDCTVILTPSGSKLVETIGVRIG